MCTCRTWPCVIDLTGDEIHDMNGNTGGRVLSASSAAPTS